jgi:hypothetical protein
VKPKGSLNVNNGRNSTNLSQRQLKRELPEAFSRNTQQAASQEALSVHLCLKALPQLPI